MTKNIIRISIIMAVIGAIICIISFVMVGFNFEKLGTASTYEKKYMSMSIDGISEINVNTSFSKITLSPTDNEEISFSYYQSNKEYYDFNVSSSRLSMKSVNNKRWYDYISVNPFNINFKNREITIEVPRSYSGSLVLNTSYGDISVYGLDGLVFVDLKTSYGDISTSNITTKQRMDIKSSYGDLAIKRCNVGQDITLDTSYGTIDLVSLTASSINAGTSYGDISLIQLAVDNIKLKSSFGDITGNIDGYYDDYRIRSHTSMGDNNLPHSKASGEKGLDVDTSHGDINIEFDLR